MIVHEYLSTGCLHAQDPELSAEKVRQLHAYCQAMTGAAGVKRPGRCKFCNARCQCSCHDEPDVQN